MITMVLIMVLNLFSLNESIYDYSFKTIDGESKSFADFKGKKILIVNTASKCGFTKQYKDLQKLHETYGKQLVIIGFPANNFGSQEPGSNEEINSFCEKNYGVTFLMAEKVDVKGDSINPIFKYLTAQPNPDFTGEIKWNFEKFLINEDGKLIHRYRSKITPTDELIISQL